MTTLMTERCAVCGTTRPLAELLRTHRRAAPGHVAYVCRPSLLATCFAAVPSRDEVRIAAAIDREGEHGNGSAKGARP